MNSINRQKNFDTQKFSGLWYELSRSEHISFQRGDFTTWEFTPNEDGTMQVKLTTKLKNGNTIANEALAKRLINAKYSLSGASWFGRYFPNDINVVETDYSSYAILVSRPSLSFWRTTYGWILARRPDVERSYLRYLNYILQEKGSVSSFLMRETKQAAAE